MKLWWKKYWHHGLAFALPFVIMGILYACFQVYPFGNDSVLVLDLNGQYVSYFEALRAAVFDGKSLLYSFGRSLSGEMLGIVAYYLLSPFSLLVLLFPKSHITEAIFLMTLLKVSCSGLAFSFYLKDKKIRQIDAVILSISYALCSYAVVQVMNLMWMDAVLALPILIWSIEQLVRKEKGNWFTLVLLYLFWTNYYIAYMIGILSFGYFIYFLLLERKRLFATPLFLFIRQTFLAILCSLWLLLPTIYSLTLGKSEFSKPNYDLYSKFNLVDFFVKWLPATYDSVNIQGLPFVYVGTLALLLVPLYFINRSISLREKALSFALMALLIVVMNVSTFDLFLHGLQNPNWLNYRYAFFFSFFLLSLMAKCLANKDGIGQKDIVHVALVAAAFVMFVQTQDYSFVQDETTIWLALGCLGLYVGFLLLVYQNERYHALRYVMLLLVCVELFLNGLTSLVALDHEVLYSTRDSYIPYMEEIRSPLATIDAFDPGMYRIEKTFHRTVNDPLSLGMRGISHSTSTLNVKAIALLHRLGFSARDHWTKYLGATPVSDSLLGIRYVLSKEEAVPYYDMVLTDNAISVYQNPYALSLAFAASKQILEIEMQQASPLVLQSKLLNRLLGNEVEIDYFVPVPVKEIILDNVQQSKIAGHDSYKPIDDTSNAQVEFVLPPGEQPIYLYFPTNYEREVNLWIDGEWLDTFYGNESYRIMQLSPSTEDRHLIMTITNHEVYLKEHTAYFYELDVAKFAEAMATLQAGNLEITSYSESRMEGNVHAKQDGIMMTSLPYEKGWKIVVDGKQVDYYMVADALIAFDLAAGEHRIVMKFTPVGMNLGLLLGVFGGLLWGIFAWMEHRAKKAKESTIPGDVSVDMPEIDAQALDLELNEIACELGLDDGANQT